MNYLFDQGASGEAWSARYEQLRADWLKQETGWGASLFIRQGMAAWMNAWTEATPPNSENRFEQVVCESASSQSIAMSGDLQRQLTLAFANLIFHRQQEVLA